MGHARRKGGLTPAQNAAHSQGAAADGQAQARLRGRQLRARIYFRDAVVYALGAD